MLQQYSAVYLLHCTLYPHAMPAIYQTPLTRETLNMLSPYMVGKFKRLLSLTVITVYVNMKLGTRPQGM